MQSGWLVAWLGALLGGFSLHWFSSPAFWIFTVFAILWVHSKSLLLISAGLGVVCFLVRFELVQHSALRVALLRPQYVEVCGRAHTKYGSVLEIKDADLSTLIGRKFYFSKPIRIGSCFRAKANFRALGSSETPSFPPQEVKRELRGPVGSIRLDKVPEAVLESNLPNISLGKAFQFALVQGVGEFLPTEIWEASKRLGIIHLFVISGLHIGWIFLAIRLFFQFFLPRFQILAPWLSAVGVLSYVFVFNLGLPAQRAAGLFLLVSIVPKAFPPIRRFSALEKCAIVGFVFILFNPLALPSSTYVLSFGVCFALLIPRRSFSRMFAATASACFLGALLYMPLYPITFAANLLLIPSFACLIFPTVVLTTWISWLDTFQESLCRYFSTALIQVSEWSSFLPALTISFDQAFLLLSFGLIILFYRDRIPRKLTLILLAISLGSAVLPNFVPSFSRSLEALDVGQGDGLVLRLWNRTILIDGGKHRYLSEQLRQRNIRKIDLWVLSHFDEDHIGNFREVSRDFEVKEVWIPRWDHSAISHWIRENYGDRVRSADRQELSLKTFLYELKGSIVVNSDLMRPVKNRDSLVLELWRNNRLGAIFLGDLPAAQEKKWLRKHKNTKKAPKLLIKVAHHGSSTSTSKEILEFFRPKLAIICVGRGNSYRFPHSSVLDRLETEGATIRRTDTLGSLKINLDF